MQNMIVDSHAHFADEKFDNERDELLKEMLSKYVQSITEVGYDLESSKRAVKLAHKYEEISAAVGIHPAYAGDCLEKDIAEIRGLAESGMKNNLVIAIGEIGLDYYDKTITEDNKKRQLAYFRSQLDLAMELKLPVIIHSIKAANDTLNIVKEYYKKSNGSLTGIMHGFNYSKEIAWEYIKLGFKIGIGDVITYDNSKKIKEVVRNIPRDKIVIESDGKINIRLVEDSLNKICDYYEK